MVFDGHYTLEDYCTLKNYPIDVTRLKGLLEQWDAAGDDLECKEEVIAEALARLPVAVSNMVAREWKTEVSEDERRNIVRAVLAELDFKESQGFFQEHESFVTYGQYYGLLEDYGRTALDRLRNATYEPGAPGEITFYWEETLSGREWLIPGWLPVRRVAILSGEVGWGESRLALQLAAAVAAGDPKWLEGGPATTKPQSILAKLDGRGYEPPLVVFATWEDEPYDVERCLHRMGDRAAKVGDRLHLLDFAGKGPLWQAPEHSGVVDPRVVADYGSGELARAGPVDAGSRHINTLAPAGHWLRAYCQHYSPALLVVDPLELAFGYNESDRSPARAFIASWDVWARVTDCAVLFVAHASKSEAAYSSLTDWQAACRSVWTFGLEPIPNPKTGEAKDTGDKPDKAPRLACINSSYVAQPKPLWLESDEGGSWRVINANLPRGVA